MNDTIYHAAYALHRWCRGEAPRREYRAARERAVLEDAAQPLARKAAALIALVPADRRDRAIRRCTVLAGGVTLAGLRNEIRSASLPIHRDL